MITRHTAKHTYIRVYKHNVRFKAAVNGTLFEPMPRCDSQRKYQHKLSTKKKKTLNDKCSFVIIDKVDFNWKLTVANYHQLWRASDLFENGAEIWQKK